MNIRILTYLDKAIEGEILQVVRRGKGWQLAGIGNVPFYIAFLPINL